MLVDLREMTDQGGIRRRFRVWHRRSVAREQSIRGRANQGRKSSGTDRFLKDVDPVFLEVGWDVHVRQLRVYAQLRYALAGK